MELCYKKYYSEPERSKKATDRVREWRENNPERLKKNRDRENRKKRLETENKRKERQKIIDQVLIYLISSNLRRLVIIQTFNPCGLKII